MINAKTRLLGQRHASVKSETWSNEFTETNLPRLIIFWRKRLVYLCLITFKAMSVVPLRITSIF